MAKRTGPLKINQYGLEFKLRAVQLSNQPGVLVKDVAQSLDIHPFMLSKWRKQVRDWELSGKPPPIEQPRWRNCSEATKVEAKFYP
jgi:transposase